MEEPLGMDRGGDSRMAVERVLKAYFALIAPSCDYLSFFTHAEQQWIADVLLRKEEQQISHRDQWGNWEFPFTNEQYTLPYVDRFVLDRLGGKDKFPETPWPEKRRFAAWLTHDLDVLSLSDPLALLRRQMQAARHAAGYAEKALHYAHAAYSRLRSLRPAQQDPLWLYERWMDAEIAHGFNSTFFVFSRPSSKNDLHLYDCDYVWSDRMMYRACRMNAGDFIKRIMGEGVEIACHGSFNTWRNAALLKQQKDNLEDLIGKPVLASRQHFLHYDIHHTPDVLKEAGFKVDSTMGFNRTIGFRAGTSYPYKMLNGLLEVPQIIMDGALFNTNSLELDELLACRKIEKIMNEVETSGGCLTINFHPNYLLNPAWWNTYLFILKELKARNAACVNAASILELTEI
ncbi:MAG: polysaccharide deacetylase family protein [Bacteroidia bacterium]|nr:polysaccharide deacetylase family protein [Bacteroidia bacterium]